MLGVASGGGGLSHPLLELRSVRQPGERIVHGKRGQLLSGFDLTLGVVPGGDALLLDAVNPWGPSDRRGDPVVAAE